jgi:hypothetical protein
MMSLLGSKSTDGRRLLESNRTAARTVPLRPRRRMPLHGLELRSPSAFPYSALDRLWLLRQDRRGLRLNRRQGRCVCPVMAAPDRQQLHHECAALGAWRTNDAKNDLSCDDFIDLCVSVLRHAGHNVAKDGET